MSIRAQRPLILTFSLLGMGVFVIVAGCDVRQTQPPGTTAQASPKQSSEPADNASGKTPKSEQASTESQPNAAEHPAPSEDPVLAPADGSGENEAGENGEPQVDPFEVPDGTVAELLEFIQRLQFTRPSDTTQEARMAHQQKVAQALIGAADKILAQDPAAEDLLRAVEIKMAILNFLAASGDEKAAEEKTKFQEELPMQLGRIVAHVKEIPETADRFRQAMSVDRILSRAGDAGAAAELYAAVGDLNIEGALVDGTPFDWAAYRGKVVLVDFWATWCGPCIGELPNVLDNYRKYHDKGFDVIGISLDDKQEKLEKFLADQEIPWPILFGSEEAERGWRHPMAQRYGIDGIPAAILVDQEGKVVSLNARGPALGEALARLLGPVEDAPPTDDPSTTEPAEGDKSADANPTAEPTEEPTEGAKEDATKVEAPKDEGAPTDQDGEKPSATPGE